MNKIRKTLIDYSIEMYNVDKEYNKSDISFEELTRKQHRITNEFTKQIFDIIDWLVPEDDKLRIFTKQKHQDIYTFGFADAKEETKQNIAKLKEGE